MVKKYYKTIVSLLLLFVFVLSCFAFASCAYSPSGMEVWYLTAIEEGGKRYSAYNEDYYKGNFLSSDYLVFQFDEDGTVKITDWEGNVEKGTYTEKDNRKDTAVTVNLENGQVLTGTCAKYAFDGVWYEFSLTDGEVTYELTEENEAPKKNACVTLLKDAYPEISALALADITELRFGENALITDSSEIHKFFDCFQTAYINKRFQNANGVKTESDLIVVADKEYSLKMRVRMFSQTSIFVDVCYQEEYYELLGDLHEFLLNYAEVPELKEGENDL